MILKDIGWKRRIRWGYLLLSIMATGSVLASVSYLFLVSKPDPKIQTGFILCDAEEVAEGYFIGRGHKFSRGKLQSADFSRSGQFSCKLEKAEEALYGFAFELYNPDPGSTYKVSVWRKKNFFNRGMLIVSARGKEGFYQRQTDAVPQAEGEWERLETSFVIPFNKAIDTVDIYVFSDGTQTVYFDDLKIEKVNQWGEKDFQPSVLELEIEEKALKKLEQKRLEAFEKGILESTDKDWVKAKLSEPDQDAFPVEIRLKGDWLDHLIGKKWSFRVKTAPAYAWKNMKTFSLHTPSARYFLREWLLHQLWEKEDVLTTRYDFVELRLNGESLGIYAYEEHFDKQLLESRARREGPILKLSESGYWAGIQRQLESYGYLRQNAEHSAMQKENAQTEVFKEKRLIENPALREQFETARDLMFQFKERTESVASIFEIERLARFYAIADVLNAYHGIKWHNQRFYFNPVLSKLEPIGFDGYGEKPEPQFTIQGHGALHPILAQENSFTATLFSDPDFIRNYIQALERISSKAYMDTFLDSLYSTLQPRLEWLQLEFPDYKLNIEDLKREIAYVHSLILPFNGQSVQTYTKSIEKGWRHTFAKNTHLLPVEIIGYGRSNKQINQFWEEPILFPGLKARILKNRLARSSTGKVQDFEQMRFLDAIALKDQQISWMQDFNVPASAKYIFYRPLGLDTVFYSTISEYPIPDYFNLNARLFEQSIPKSNAVYGLEGKKIIFAAGRHDLDQDIVIPKGYEVYFESGVELNLTNRASFISYSPVQMYGTAEVPIKIQSTDKTGGGFTILQAASRSTLSHVVFDGMNTLNKTGWTLTGAVTFYESEVELNKCLFQNIPCEDALNIIRSTFKLDFCRFTDISFDAFDSDFSKGKINNSYFYRIGNDAMDFSGSIITIRDCVAQYCGDKGVSVGEDSDAYLYSSTIEHCPIGVASKDLSVFYIDGISLKNCDQGFVAFQKKAEYGGSTIVVKNYTASNFKRLYAISKGCSLQLKDQLIK